MLDCWLYRITGDNVHIGLHRFFFLDNGISCGLVVRTVLEQCIDSDFHWRVTIVLIGLCLLELKCQKNMRLENWENYLCQRELRPPREEHLKVFRKKKGSLVDLLMYKLHENRNKAWFVLCIHIPTSNI